MKTSDVNFYGAEWICPHKLGDAPVNTYVEFRRSVRLPEFDGSEGARLKIAADTAYAVWVNGSPAGAGVFPDVPPERQFDDLDVARFLRRGTNSLRIVLYIQGADSFQHIPGDAGVLFCLTACGEAFVSGPEVSWRVSPCYHSGKMPRRTSQLGFTFEYDSRREQCDSGWKKICEKELLPRDAFEDSGV